jgi:hypothetical protein
VAFFTRDRISIFFTVAFVVAGLTGSNEGVGPRKKIKKKKECYLQYCTRHRTAGVGFADLACSNLKP